MFDKQMASGAPDYDMELHIAASKELVGLQAEQTVLRNRVNRLKADIGDEEQKARLVHEQELKAEAVAAVAAYEQSVLAMVDAALFATAAIRADQVLIGQIQKFQESMKRGPLALRAPDLHILDLGQCLKMEKPMLNAMGQLKRTV